MLKYFQVGWCKYTAPRLNWKQSFAFPKGLLLDVSWGEKNKERERERERNNENDYEATCFQRESKGP